MDNGCYSKIMFLIPSLTLHSKVILPDLWETAVDLFDASRTGVISDRKRTQKVQEKVCSRKGRCVSLTAMCAELAT